MTNNKDIDKVVEEIAKIAIYEHCSATNEGCDFFDTDECENGGLYEGELCPTYEHIHRIVKKVINKANANDLTLSDLIKQYLSGELVRIDKQDAVDMIEMMRRDCNDWDDWIALLKPIAGKEKR